MAGVTIFFITAFIAYWWYNRKKFHQLSHQIPASVVKNYLDSIISNSNALKSSLFRGGGLELGEGIPSVLPTSDLPRGNVSMGGASTEELNQKNAEIARLKATVSEKDKTIEELERMLAAARDANGGGISDEEANIMKGEISSLQEKLQKAQADLEAAQAGGGGGGADSAELDAVTKERDELKERLQEYEVIEEDLANIKKFQQENEQLKKTIEQLQAGGAAPAAEPAAEPEPAPEPEAPAEPEPAPVEEPPADEPAAEEPAAEAPAPEAAVDEAEATSEAEDTPDVPANEGEQKSAEELLSEFEKMLG